MRDYTPNERAADLSPCPDCHVDPGFEHDRGCDVERCPCCGDQWIKAGHEHEGVARIPWSGRWPGDLEAEEFGWYSKLIPGRGWVSCDPSDPGATEDLNRVAKAAAGLIAGFAWSPKAGRVVRL